MGLYIYIYMCICDIVESLHRHCSSQLTPTQLGEPIFILNGMSLAVLQDAKGEYVKPFIQ